MRVTVTRKESEQISMDDYRVFTQVYHFNPDITLDGVWNFFNRGGKHSDDVNVELHFDLSEERAKK